jgi:uncharacterized protein
MDKPTVVVGASPKPDRYSNKAVRCLQNYKHTVYPVGIHKGDINGAVIELEKPAYQNIHTVTLYVAPAHQDYWIPYILSLKPKRIIFNPGTENPAFFTEATQQGIHCLEACTLVMLSIGSY